MKLNRAAGNLTFNNSQSLGDSLSSLSSPFICLPFTAYSSRIPSYAKVISCTGTAVDTLQEMDSGLDQFPEDVTRKLSASTLTDHLS